MSSNNPPNDFQYASSIPSVSSILILAQVQDKKKTTAMTSGLAKKPVGTLGLAPTGTKGTLKLLPKTASKPFSGGSFDTVSSLVNNMNITEPKPSLVEPLTAKSEPATSIDISTATHVKVGKPKTKTKSDNKMTVKKSVHQLNQHQSQAQDHFDPSHWRLFVGNLGPEVSDPLLLSSFQNSYPSCSKALIIRDWKSQKSKGYGFVTFSEGKDFLKALKEMQGKWIGNRQCIIKKSEHQPNLNK